MNDYCFSYSGVGLTYSFSLLCFSSASASRALACCSLASVSWCCRSLCLLIFSKLCMKAKKQTAAEMIDACQPVLKAARSGSLRFHEQKPKISFNRRTVSCVGRSNGLQFSGNFEKSSLIITKYPFEGAFCLTAAPSWFAEWFNRISWSWTILLLYDFLLKDNVLHPQQPGLQLP